MMKLVSGIGVAIILLLSTPAIAQATQSERLAQQWREVRLAELNAERARIDAQIAVLSNALPDMAPASPAMTVPSLPTVSAATATISVTKDAKSTAFPDDGGESQPTPKDHQNFGGLDLGVGLSFTLDVGKNDWISRA